MRTIRTAAGLLALGGLMLPPGLLMAVVFTSAAVIAWAAREIGDTP